MDDHSLLRYSRQILLPEIDIEGQQRLLEARVLIVGLGGLGSPVALYLAAAGVGTLVLNDFDQVDLSNLQRQIIHRHADIGRPKVESARDALLALNPEVQIECLAGQLQAEQLRAVVERVDVVVDACDNLATRFLVNQACVDTATALVSAAAIRLEGKLLVYDPRQANSPCYRCLYRGEEAPAETCSESGVVAPLVGLLGSLQALEVIKLIVGYGNRSAGRLLLFDGRTLEFHEVQVGRNPHCPSCGAKRKET